MLKGIKEMIQYMIKAVIVTRNTSLLNINFTTPVLKVYFLTKYINYSISLFYFYSGNTVMKINVNYPTVLYKSPGITGKVSGQ